MAIQFSIDRLIIDAPEGWVGSADMFRRLLEEAIQQELQTVLQGGSIQEHEAIQLDIPSMTVNDIYDMQDTAREIARRIVQAVRQPQESVSQES